MADSSSRNVALIPPPDTDGGEFERSLDFSKLPKLQVVTLKLAFLSGGLRWIAMALSTIKPTTSPSLSTIRVDLACLNATTRPERLTEDTRNNLRRVTDEVVRIEREFSGALNLTVFTDPSV